MSLAGRARGVVGTWAATRVLLLLTVLGVLPVPGPDVTTDVSVIYQGWYELLRAGTFPLDDVTWQYPPGAALAVLAPGLLPFLTYATAFFVIALAVDATTLGLLVRADGERRGGRRGGAWVWTAGVPLLGPTVYARYDLLVTAAAVAALLAAARRPKLSGALVGLGALLKVWPLLLLVGTARGRHTRDARAAAGATAVALSAWFWLSMPGAFAFLGFQRERGTEIESLGSVVFHIARHLGWGGQVMLNYGSVEFLGPGVRLVSHAALVLTTTSFGWLLVWRLRARRFTAATPFDAAFTAVLLFTVTSRVISPQYMVWLVGLAAVCLTERTTSQRRSALLVLAATGVTLLEYPIWSSHVVHSDPLGIALLTLRNGLLAAAALRSCRSLWCATVGSGPGLAKVPEARQVAHVGSTYTSERVTGRQ
ncbi:glycosyltransferase 87 family protein [Wenjunlia tyrosinilytica]|uniref:Membrane protein n=1 Tax=Wenjunlia tyrosinilytica TaxID=1544741 RepID=A0A917ZFG7_9ACTN|nr:glycosyltransferase 87 family protein [Wenjunlia tyrosinilytica]GGO81985.1 membrane protein [Wenjunlia tyrosinilytica]